MQPAAPGLARSSADHAAPSLPAQTVHRLASELTDIEQARTPLIAAAPRMRSNAPAGPLTTRNRARVSADAVPIMVGSILGLLLLVAFGTAVGLVELSR
jgi:hypothetical protein